MQGTTFVLAPCRLPRNCLAAMQDSLFDPAELQAKVREYRSKAHEAGDAAESEFFRDAARAYVLLAMNAAWIKSTDQFLEAIDKKQPWPHPRLAEAMSSP